MAKQTFTTGQVLTAAQMTSLQQTAMLGGDASVKTASYVLVAADAGTTVAMNAAGSTTITVNTGLFSAGDIVFIQNRGAGNCTVTAGTATVSTAGSLILPQNDAGILYFTSASAAIFYDFIQTGATSPLTTKGDLYTFSTSDARLPVGTNGYTLVADSAESTGLKWAAPSSSSGPAFFAERATSTQSITLGANTKIQFNSEVFDTDNCFDSTTNYRFTPNKSGYYQINATVNVSGGSLTIFRIKLYKNGSFFLQGNDMQKNADAYAGGVVSAVMYFNGTTDYVEVYGNPGGSGSADVNTGTTTHFSGVWIRS